MYGGANGLLPTLFTLVPKGQTSSPPSWIADTKFTTSQLFADLAGSGPRFHYRNYDFGVNYNRGADYNH